MELIYVAQIAVLSLFGTLMLMMGRGAVTLTSCRNVALKTLAATSAALGVLANVASSFTLSSGLKTFLLASIGTASIAEVVDMVASHWRNCQCDCPGGASSTGGKQQHAAKFYSAEESGEVPEESPEPEEQAEVEEKESGEEKGGHHCVHVHLSSDKRNGEPLLVKSRHLQKGGGQRSLKNYILLPAEATEKNYNVSLALLTHQDEKRSTRKSCARCIVGIVILGALLLMLGAGLAYWFHYHPLGHLHLHMPMSLKNPFAAKPKPFYRRTYLGMLLVSFLVLLLVVVPVAVGISFAVKGRQRKQSSTKVEQTTQDQGQKDKKTKKNK